MTPPVNSEFTEFQYNLSFVPGTSLPAFVSRKNEHQDISRHKDPKKNVDEIPNLVGGLEHFLFSPIVGMMIQSDELIFFQGVKTTKQHLFCISNPLAHRVLSVQDRSTHCGQRHLECGFYSGSSAKDWSGWLNPKEPQISGSSMHFTGLC